MQRPVAICSHLFIFYDTKCLIPDIKKKIPLSLKNTVESCLDILREHNHVVSQHLVLTEGNIFIINACNVKPGLRIPWYWMDAGWDGIG